MQLGIFILVLAILSASMLWGPYMRTVPMKIRVFFVVSLAVIFVTTYLANR